MSRKKNRTQKRSTSLNATDKTALVKTNENIQDVSSVSDNSSNKSRTVIYLKKHWWIIILVIFLTVGAFGATMKYLEDSAHQDKTDGKNSGTQEQSLLARLNPFAPAAMPPVSPTPLPLSKEYIYAGSRLLAVEDANASAAPPADLAIWRPGTNSGVWWVMGGNNSQQVTQQWGTQGDKPVPGDYDGDGKTDFAVFRPDASSHSGTWYILYSSSNSWSQTQWGADNDLLTPADYDGDGKTDLAVWRATNGGWYILKSSSNFTKAQTFVFGSSLEKPAPADYDGDGKADAGLWRESNKTFYSINSSDSASQTVNFTQTSTEPVPADYDGDGRTDYAIRTGNNWIIKTSSDNIIQQIPWQSSGDKAVHNDYDGDGKCDIAVWKDSTGTWYIRKSGSGGALRQEQWGMAGDIPVPAFYRR